MAGPLQWQSHKQDVCFDSKGGEIEKDEWAIQPPANDTEAQQLKSGTLRSDGHVVAHCVYHQSPVNSTYIYVSFVIYIYIYIYNLFIFIIHTYILLLLLYMSYYIKSYYHYITFYHVILQHIILYNVISYYTILDYIMYNIYMYIYIYSIIPHAYLNYSHTCKVNKR